MKQTIKKYTHKDRKQSYKDRSVDRWNQCLNAVGWVTGIVQFRHNN